MNRAAPLVTLVSALAQTACANAAFRSNVPIDVAVSTPIDATAPADTMPATDVGLAIDVPEASVVRDALAPADDVAVVPADDAATVVHADAVVIPGDDGVAVVHDDAAQPADAAPVTTTVTLRAVQDPSAATHPAPGSTVTLSDTNLVALTPRIAFGGTTGTSCRFGVWVGTGTDSDFSAVLVTEAFPRGTATSCYNAPAGRIPTTIAPGDPVHSVASAYLVEFCLGATGVTGAACNPWLQTQLQVDRAGAVFDVGTGGGAPLPTTVRVSEVGEAQDGVTLGPRTSALEGALLRVNDMAVYQTLSSTGTVTLTQLFDASDTSYAGPSLVIDVSNFIAAPCVRSYLHTAYSLGMHVGSVTGILAPTQGRWSLRVRNENDVSGSGCGDAGTGG